MRAIWRSEALTSQVLLRSRMAASAGFGRGGLAGAQALALVRVVCVTAAPLERF